MRLASCEESRLIDLESQKNYKLPEDVLMESAGSLAAREIEVNYQPELKEGRVCVLCGPGHNGGDGMVVARHLNSRGYKHISVFYMASDKHSKLYKSQLQRLRLQKIDVTPIFDNPQNVFVNIQSAELVVDALFGTGLTKAIGADLGSLMEQVNQGPAPCVSLDCPSGLDADCGQILDFAIRADLTLSFGLAKRGFFVSQGPGCTGRLQVIPIGFPKEVVKRIAKTQLLFTQKLAKRYIPFRPEGANKSDFGRCLIVAGSSGKWGAASLASVAALRTGAGYVSLLSSEFPQEILRERPEIMSLEWSSPKEILEGQKWDSILIGPGAGFAKEIAELIEALKLYPKIKVVLDADAFQVCRTEELYPLPHHWLLTPHSGELGRILNISSAEVEKDRFKYAHELQEKWGAQVLLKGFRSVLSFQNKTIVIHSGNVGLAKAGTGDVLSGMIASFMAQGLSTTKAGALAAFVHGYLADQWRRQRKDLSSLTATDLLQALPEYLHFIRTGH